MESEMIKEKIGQVAGVMREYDIDCWLIFVRETETIHDPSLDLVAGCNATWQSAFLFSADGRSIAIVGSLDMARVERTGHFDDVRGYVGGISEDLRNALQELDPRRIAINYSRDSELADGLTHGMYLLLSEILAPTPYAQRLISAEELISALRGRKTPAEVERIREACRATVEIYLGLTDKMHVEMTEQDVAALINTHMNEMGLEPAWEPIQCPAVFTGPGSAGAHAGPTETKIEPGHILNTDFGVKFKGYCSDLQRTWYFLQAGEKKAPPAVQKGFDTIRDAVHKAAAAIQPGRPGWEIDQVARSHIVEQGYEEYPHALGHQVGRMAHDGTGLLCPRWERYGERPYDQIEVGQVYTIEPRLTVEGHGIATIEEIVWITDHGVEFLSEPQTELYLVPYRKDGRNTRKK